MAEFGSSAAEWAAIGEYGRVLSGVPAYEMVGTPIKSPEVPAAIARASTLRQLGRYEAARRCDEAALRAAASVSARVAARLGLAADAVGSADPQLARRWLAAAEPLDSDVLRVMAGWVWTEVALLTDDPASAVWSATEDVARAEAMAAPWHLAKSLLFRGVARLAAGDTGPGVADLTEVAARSADWPALGWVAAAVLADRDPEPGRRAGWAPAAAAAIGRIAAGLPPDIRADWLSQPGIAIFLVETGKR